MLGKIISIEDNIVEVDLSVKIYDMDNNLLVEGNAKYFKVPFKKMFGENTTQHEEMCYEMPLDIKEIDFPEIEK